MGVDRSLWYAADSANWGTLISNGALTQQGIAYREAMKWLLGASFTTPIARVAAANLIRNPTGAGAAAGSPGTLPTDWGLYAPDSAHGINTQIISTNPLTIRIWGIATSGASGETQISFETGTQVAATLRQQFAIGLTATVVAGSTTNCQTWLSANEVNSSGSYLASTLFLPIFLPSGPVPIDWLFRTANQAVVAIQPSWTVTYAIGVPFDITLGLASPYVDTGSVWSGTIAKPGGYAGQIVWDSAGGPTRYIPGGSLIYQRDILGGSRPIVAGFVTLGASPLLLENQQWKGWVP